MNRRIIDDITDFIFVSDEPQEVDIVFLPGGSNPLPPEMAATLYKGGYAPLLLPFGGVSIKHEKFAGVKSRADIDDLDYQVGGIAMRLTGHRLSEEQAKEISSWKYSGEYSVYNLPPWDKMFQENYSLTDAVKRRYCILRNWP